MMNNNVIHSKWVRNADDDIIVYCANCLMPSDGFADECLSCGAKIDDNVNEQIFNEEDDE